MKNLIYVLSLIFLLWACESEVTDDECDITTLNIKGTANINGTSRCYDQGSLIHDANDAFLILNLRNMGDDDQSFKAYFQVPIDGFNFKTEYTGVQGEFEGKDIFKSGSLSITSDNYPTDPTLMKYAGNFEVTFEDGTKQYVLDGKFSFEQP